MPVRATESFSLIVALSFVHYDINFIHCLTVKLDCIYPLPKTSALCLQIYTAHDSVIRIPFRQHWREYIVMPPFICGWVSAYHTSHFTLWAQSLKKLLMTRFSGTLLILGLRVKGNGQLEHFACKPYEQNRDYKFCQIAFKFHTLVMKLLMMWIVTPFDLWSKVKLTLALCTWNIVSTIQTTVFANSLPGLTYNLFMIRGWTLLI